MSALLQEAVVGLLVLAAAAFATWRLASPRLRVELLRRIESRASDGDFAGPLVRRIMKSLLRRSAAELASGCGSCSGSAAKHGAARSHARPSH